VFLGQTLRDGGDNVDEDAAPAVVVAVIVIVDANSAATATAVFVFGRRRRRKVPCSDRLLKGPFPTLPLFLLLTEERE